MVDPDARPWFGLVVIVLYAAVPACGRAVTTPVEFFLFAIRLVLVKRGKPNVVAGYSPLRSWRHLIKVWRRQRMTRRLWKLWHGR